jgi:hypothetical protein
MMYTYHDIHHPHPHAHAPSIAQLRCAGGRSTLRTSMTVGRKSLVMTVAHDSRAGPRTTAGHDTTPGTR